MLNKPQDQKAGDGAVAIQTAGSTENVTVTQENNYNYGLTVDEVRAVAKDAYRSDFYQLLGQAGDIAEARANRVIERYLDRLQSEYPAGLNQANTPDFRYALLTAQKAQARSGDENLEELLVELLIERSREGQRSLLQIVLNEALETVSRITEEQVAALTVSFAVRRVVRSLVDFEEFLATMDEHVAPYVSRAKLSNASFSHLVYTGCGVLEPVGTALSECFRQFYPGIWQTGFHEHDIIFQQLGPQARRLVRPNLSTPGFYEVIAGSKGMLERLQEATIPDFTQRALLSELMTRSHLSPEQIKGRCIAARAYMGEMFDLWDNTEMKNFNLSSIGVAIAHANLTRSSPNLPPISVWIK